jgi:hypothetical protein
MLYLSATPRVVALLTAALGELRDPKFEFNEQKVLSYLLLPAMARGTPWEGITLKWLPKPEFPSGREYFGLVCMTPLSSLHNMHICGAMHCLSMSAVDVAQV